MNCLEAEQFFDAYLDGELAGSLRLEFDAHRLRCPVCQQKLAMTEACEHILARDSRPPALSDDFADRVMNEVGERRVIARRTRKRRLLLAGSIALQAAAVIAFAVVWSGYWKAKPTAGPALEAVDWEEFHAEQDLAFIEKNRVMLEDAIISRLLTAQSNLKNEVSGLARYASGISILSDLPSPSDATPSPLRGFLRIFAPAAPEETEPTPSATGPVSL